MFVLQCLIKSWLDKLLWNENVRTTWVLPGSPQNLVMSRHVYWPTIPDLVLHLFVLSMISPWVVLNTWAAGTSYLTLLCLSDFNWNLKNQSGESLLESDQSREQISVSPPDFSKVNITDLFPKHRCVYTAIITSPILWRFQRIHSLTATIRGICLPLGW